MLYFNVNHTMSPALTVITIKSRNLFKPYKLLKLLNYFLRLCLWNFLDFLYCLPQRLWIIAPSLNIRINIYKLIFLNYSNFAYEKNVEMIETDIVKYNHICVHVIIF